VIKPYIIHYVTLCGSDSVDVMQAHTMAPWQAQPLSGQTRIIDDVCAGRSTATLLVSPPAVQHYSRHGCMQPRQLQALHAGLPVTTACSHHTEDAQLAGAQSCPCPGHSILLGRECACACKLWASTARRPEQSMGHVAWRQNLPSCVDHSARTVAGQSTVATSGQLTSPGVGVGHVDQVLVKVVSDAC
jgi:hypothetical protein